MMFKRTQRKMNGVHIPGVGTKSSNDWAFNGELFENNKGICCSTGGKPPGGCGEDSLWE